MNNKETYRNKANKTLTMTKTSRERSEKKEDLPNIDTEVELEGGCKISTLAASRCMVHIKWVHTSEAASVGTTEVLSTQVITEDITRGTTDSMAPCMVD
jgi:hypothetical protein